MLKAIINKSKLYIDSKVFEARTKKKIATILQSGQDVKLEIGSGPVKGKDGWTTLDLSNESDLYWDLLKPLPFPDNAIAVIYSSHVFEHFYYADLMKLLRECFRTLKPDGIINVCVPDASIYIKAYSNPDEFDRSFLAYSPAVISDQNIDIVNYMAYMDGHHRYMFDKDNLLRVLSDSGFIDVYNRNFDSLLDLPERNHESIYGIGKKPL